MWLFNSPSCPPRFMRLLFPLRVIARETHERTPVRSQTDGPTWWPNLYPIGSYFFISNHDEGRNHFLFDWDSNQWALGGKDFSRRVITHRRLSRTPTLIDANEVNETSFNRKRRSFFFSRSALFFFLAEKICMLQPKFQLSGRNNSHDVSSRVYLSGRDRKKSNKNAPIFTRLFFFFFS